METVRAQAQLAENLQAQQLLGEGALKEIREKVDKLDEAAKTVTISVPYVQQGRYLEQPQAQGFEFLEVQPSAALPAVFQNSKTGSIAGPDNISDLLDSSRETLVFPLQVPKTPDTSPKIKRKQPAPQQLQQEGPNSQGALVDIPEDLCLKEKGRKHPAPEQVMGVPPT